MTAYTNPSAKAMETTGGTFHEEVEAALGPAAEKPQETGTGA
jgi:hypothetical protein